MRGEKKLITKRVGGRENELSHSGKKGQNSSDERVERGIRERESP